MRGLSVFIFISGGIGVCWAGAYDVCVQVGGIRVIFEEDLEGFWHGYWIGLEKKGESVGSGV